MSTDKAKARLWAHVIADGDGCWEYDNCYPTVGYGMIASGGGKPAYIYAHRLSYEIWNGPIPKDLWVLHKCDNPSCCRPDHLYLGTAVENGRDQRVRGRSPHGAGHYRAKLSDEDVAEIRRLGTKGGVSHKAIALRFNVQRSLISMILSGARRSTSSGVLIKP
jgi:hypothetical protein